MTPSTSCKIRNSEFCSKFLVIIIFCCPLNLMWFCETNEKEKQPQTVVEFRRCSRGGGVHLPYSISLFVHFASRLSVIGGTHLRHEPLSHCVQRSKYEKTYIFSTWDGDLLQKSVGKGITIYKYFHKIVSIIFPSFFHSGSWVLAGFLQVHCY